MTSKAKPKSPEPVGAAPTLPFSRLVAGRDVNARAGGTRKSELEGLAASIKARGLIQPLVVRPLDDGRHEVVAGNRRLAAIGLLVKAKDLPKTWGVPVVVRNEDDGEALETSLAENMERLPMHPVDQYAVFARRAEQGRSPADIAASFGLAERTVKQQLALGRLAPQVREAWKAGEIEAAIAQAFTLGRDHDEQAATLARLKKQGKWALDAHNVRRELTRERPSAKGSAELALVGIEAYEAAGGRLTDNLFDDERLIESPDVLARLVRTKLAATAADLMAQGWSWAAPQEDLPRDARWWEQLGEEDGHEDGAPWSAEHKARAGVILSVVWDGKTPVVWMEEGVLRPDAAEDGAGDEDGQSDLEDFTGEGGDDEQAPYEHGPGGSEHEAGEADADDPFAISSALRQTVTEGLTKAAAAALRTNPDLAMRVVIAALATQFTAPARLRAEGHASVAEPAEHKFAQALALALGMPQHAAEERFAAAIAGTLDLTEGTWMYKGRDTGIEALIAALPGEEFLEAARSEFLPEDYFKRASRATAHAAIVEMGAAWAGADWKKAAVAEYAAAQARQHGWLPPQLRHPDYRGAGSTGTSVERAA